MYTAIPTIRSRPSDRGGCEIVDGAPLIRARLLLRLDQQMADPVINALKKFIVFSKASITDKSDVLACYATTLPSDRDVLTFSRGSRRGIWTSESLTR